jgi:ketosteroid isomerase-like protein
MVSRTSSPLLIVLLGVVACAPGDVATAGATQADSAAVNDLRQQALAAVNAGDATLAYMADDVVLLPPNAPAVSGLAAARAWFGEATRQFRFSLAYTSCNVEFAGDLAIERCAGTLTVTPVAGGPAVSDVWKGIHLYRRDATGGWKLALDIWNSDKPIEP